MMNTFSLHGDNMRRNDAFPPPKSRGSSRQKLDGVKNTGEAVAVIISHPPYGSTEQQMLKRLMSNMKVRGSSCFSLRQMFLRDCAWGGGGGTRNKRQSRGTDAIKWREGNILPTTAGPPASMQSSVDSSDDADNEQKYSNRHNGGNVEVNHSLESSSGVKTETQELRYATTDTSHTWVENEMTQPPDPLESAVEKTVVEDGREDPPPATLDLIPVAKDDNGSPDISVLSNFPNPSPISPDPRCVSSRATYPLSNGPILLLAHLRANLCRLEEVALDVKRKTYQRAHTLILRAMTLSHEKSNWAKITRRYLIMRSLQSYIGELIEENRSAQNVSARNRIHRTHHVLQRLQNNWIRKDTLTEAQARTIISRMNDSFDDVFRESGVLLLTGNPFLPEVDKEEKTISDSKTTPKRNGSKQSVATRLVQSGLASRDRDNFQSLGNVCGQNAISPRPSADPSSVENGITAGNEDRINIWMPQLPRLSSMSPPVPSPMPTTPHLLDIDINGRMRAAQRALSRVKRLPYPVNYATAVDLQQAHAAVAAVSVFGSTSVISCGGEL